MKSTQPRKATNSTNPTMPSSAERFQVERVGVLDEADLLAAVLGPPDLEAARSAADQRVGVELFERALPEGSGRCC